MSANIYELIKSRQLSRRAEPTELDTADSVQDPQKLARILHRILVKIANLSSRWVPRRFDFVDVLVDATGTEKHIFPHGFGGRVRFMVVDWVSSELSAPSLRRHADTDENTLVLVSDVEGTVTLRVEEGGA